MAAREGWTALSMVCCTRGAADTLDAAEGMRYFSCRRGRPCAFYSGRPRGGDGFGTDDEGLARGEGPWSVSGEAGLRVLLLAIKVVLEVLWLGWRALVGDWTPFAIQAFSLFCAKRRGSYPQFCAPRDSPRLSHGLSHSFTLTAGSRRHRERRPGATDAFYYRLFVCYSFALCAARYQWIAARDTPTAAPVTAYAAPGGLLAAHLWTNAAIDAVAGRSWPHGAPSAPSRAAAEFTRSQTRDASKKRFSARLARCVPAAFCEGLPFDERLIPASAHTSNTFCLRVGLAQDRATTRRSHSQRRVEHICYAASKQVWSVTVEDAKATGAPIIGPEQLAPLDKRTPSDAPSEVTFGVGGKSHKFTARPSDLHLDPKGEAKTLFGRNAEAAAAKLVADETRRGWPSENKVVLDVGRDAADLDRNAAGVLRGAAAAVARSIDATAKIRSLRVFATTDGSSSVARPMDFHADDFKGGLLRSVHVSRDAPDSYVEFGIAAFDWYNHPLPKDTFIGGVNVGGLLSYAKELIEAGETYLLNREGAGDVVLFFLKVTVDGVDVCVPFKRVHAVPRVHATRHAIVTTYFSRAEDLDDKTVYDSLAATAQPLRSRDAPGVAFAPPPPVDDASWDFSCGRRCKCCEKETSGLFVPRDGAPKDSDRTLCRECVAAKNVLDDYQRCLTDRCAECHDGCARFMDASGRQLCGGCCDGRPGYYPKREGMRCLTEGCCLRKYYVRKNAIGGVGWCRKCVPDEVEWRHQDTTNPDGTSKVPRQRSLDDDDLTEIDELRLRGGKPALADFMRRAEAGEFSIVNWQSVRTVLNYEYHYNVPRLILEDLDNIKDADWEILDSGPRQRLWERLAESLEIEVGEAAYTDAQKRRRGEAKAAKAPAAKRRKASPPKTGLAVLTVAQLKERLRGLGLKVSGLKDELVARLEDAERAATPTEPVQDSPPAVAMETDPSTGDESTPPEVAPPEDDAIESVSAPGGDDADAPPSDSDAVPMSDDDDTAPAPPDDAAPVPPDDAAPAPRDEPLLDAAVLPIPGAFAECPGCAAGEDAQGQFEGHDHPVYGCLRDLH